MAFLLSHYLEEAALGGYLAVTSRKLACESADERCPDAQSRCYLNIFAWAALAGDVAMALEALRKVTHPRQSIPVYKPLKGIDYITPLCFACLLKNEAIALQLLSQGVPEREQPVMRRIVRCLRPEMSATLWERLFELVDGPNEPDEHGVTLLHTLWSSNPNDIAQVGRVLEHSRRCGAPARALPLVLQKGADVQARTPEGATPLMLACIFGTVEDVQLLLDHNAKPDDDVEPGEGGWARGETPLWRAVFERRGERFAEVLLKAGALCDVVHQRRSAFEIAQSVDADEGTHYSAVLGRYGARTRLTAKDRLLKSLLGEPARA